METFSVKKRKLNYTIHNPNTVDDTSNMLLDILIHANENKVERKLQETMNELVTSNYNVKQSDEYD